MCTLCNECNADAESDRRCVKADVNFASGKAKISYDRKVDDDVLKNTVEKIGYHVISIS